MLTVFLEQRIGVALAQGDSAGERTISLVHNDSSYMYGQRENLVMIYARAGKANQAIDLLEHLLTTPG